MVAENSSPRVIQSNAVKNWDPSLKSYSAKNRETEVISFVSPGREYQVLMVPEMTIEDAVKEFLTIIDPSEYPRVEFKDVDLLLKIGTSRNSYTKVWAWEYSSLRMKYQVYGTGPDYKSLRGVRFEINPKKA